MAPFDLREGEGGKEADQAEGLVFKLRIIVKTLN